MLIKYSIQNEIILRRFYRKRMDTKILFFLFIIILISFTQVNCKKFGGDGPFLKLDERQSLPTKIFFDEYVKNKKAVLIKNGCNSFPARKYWLSDEYLLRASDGYDDAKFTVETIKKESRNQPILG
jgi:hypothetical protein